MAITFDAGSGNSVTVDQPLHGYQARISMPIEYYRRADGTYGSYDASSTYDRRKCENAVFEMPAATASACDAFFNNVSYGRGENISLILGASASGFFPFGPDKGDIGTFTVRILDYRASEQLHDPWLYWRREIDLQYISGPTPGYSISDTVDDGSLEIGAVSGIQYPQNGYAASTLYMNKEVVTMNGTSYETDPGTSADEYTSTLLISANKGKAGALVNELIGTVRDNNTTFVAPANNYPFGRDKAANGSFTVQPLTAELVVTHNWYDNFSFPWQMRFVSI